MEIQSDLAKQNEQKQTIIKNNSFHADLQKLNSASGGINQEPSREPSPVRNQTGTSMAAPPGVQDKQVNAHTEAQTGQKGEDANVNMQPGTAESDQELAARNQAVFNQTKPPVHVQEI